MGISWDGPVPASMWEPPRVRVREHLSRINRRMSTVLCAIIACEALVIVIEVAS